MSEQQSFFTPSCLEADMKRALERNREISAEADLEWARRHVRAQGPITSVEAAEGIAPKVGKAMEFALNVLKCFPDSTAAELEHVVICRDGQIRKRLTDLREKGLAEVVGIRKCSVGGRNAQVWRAK